MQLKIPFSVFILCSFISIYGQNVTFISNSVCQGDTTVLNAVTDIPQSDIVSYGWDLNNDAIYTDVYGKTVKTVFDT
jgi:hypothetical protein